MLHLPICQVFFMNLSLFYLLPIFLVFMFLFLFFTGQIVFTQTVEQKLRILQERVEFGNPSSEDFFLLGQIFLQKKDYDSAIKNFSSSLADWNPDDKLGVACCLNTLGVTYFNMREYDYACYYYLEAIKIFPNYLKALNNLAFLYETTKNKDEARSLYKKIWILDKANTVAREKFQALNS